MLTEQRSIGTKLLGHKTLGIDVFISREDQQNKTIMENKINNLVVCSLNCEGLCRSSDYIQNFLDSTSCDVLCL